jgi:hypothetical protein
MNPEDHLFDPEELEDEPERAMDAADDLPPDVPPIEPPIVSRGRGEAEVTGTIDEDCVEAFAHAPTSDDEITAQVRRLLHMDSAANMLPIHVSTVHCVVTLRGRVPWRTPTMPRRSPRVCPPWWTWSTRSTSKNSPSHLPGVQLAAYAPSSPRCPVRLSWRVRKGVGT